MKRSNQISQVSNWFSNQENVICNVPCKAAGSHYSPKDTSYG